MQTTSTIAQIRSMPRLTVPRRLTPADLAARADSAAASQYAIAKELIDQYERQLTALETQAVRGPLIKLNASKYGGPMLAWYVGTQAKDQFAAFLASRPPPDQEPKKAIVGVGQANPTLEHQERSKGLQRIPWPQTWGLAYAAFRAFQDAWVEYGWLANSTGAYAVDPRDGHQYFMPRGGTFKNAYFKQKWDGVHGDFYAAYKVYQQAVKMARDDARLSFRDKVIKRAPYWLTLFDSIPVGASSMVLRQMLKKQEALRRERAAQGKSDSAPSVAAAAAELAAANAAATADRRSRVIPTYNDSGNTISTTGRPTNINPSAATTEIPWLWIGIGVLVVGGIVAVATLT